MRRETGAALLFAAVAVLLSGCGDDKKDPGDPVPTITSPSSPHYGARTVQVTGSIAGGTAIKSVEVKLNQQSAGTATSAPDGKFSLPVTLKNGTNTIEVDVADDRDHTGTVSATVVYPFVEFDSFQAASLVIGQPDMTSSAANTTATSLNTPSGDLAIANNTLFVGDSQNNRVLGYSPVPTSNGPAATLVLGQSDFVSKTSYPSDASGLVTPRTVRAADGKLFVATFYGQTVKIFDPIPSANNADASIMLGQVDMAARSYACDSVTTYYVFSLFAGGGKLLVVDAEHQRILSFAPVPTQNGAAASLVVGQPNFTTCDINAGHGTTTPSDSSFYYPTDAWTDGTRLLVADEGNGRVLLWNTFPTANGAPAEVVIGQPDFVTARRDLTTARDMKFPTFIASNGNQIFVIDTPFNRVLVWNSFPTQNYQPADVVLGQADFTHNTANDDDQNGVKDSGPSARTFDRPYGLLLTDTQLYVTDSNNNRVLVFNGK